jgi:hypothetical protein
MQVTNGGRGVHVREVKGVERCETGTKIARTGFSFRRRPTLIRALAIGADHLEEDCQSDSRTPPFTVFWCGRARRVALAQASGLKRGSRT